VTSKAGLEKCSLESTLNIIDEEMDHGDRGCLRMVDSDLLELLEVFFECSVHLPSSLFGHDSLTPC